MSAFRAPGLLLRRACPCRSSISSRSFHTSQALDARPAPSPRISHPPPKQTPGVRKTPQKGGTLRRVKRDPEEDLPPIALLESARKSGSLAVEPEDALEYLRQYRAFVTKPPAAGWEPRLCNEHDITPSTMTQLAAILRRSGGRNQLTLAKKLLLSASKLGEKAATYEIVSAALSAGILKDYETELRQLGILAKKDKDPQAMTLLGKVLMAERRETEALEWFRKATSAGVEFDGAGEALVSQGRLLSQRNEKGAAKAAFEKAALELDDPSAYFYLAQLQELGSPNQQVYLLKAASSGVIEAWHNLGALELEKINKEGEQPASLADYGMAREWFQVAAADGFGLSMINLATMHKAVGEIDEALQWMKKAEGAEGVGDEARALSRQWKANTS